MTAYTGKCHIQHKQIGIWQNANPCILKGEQIEEDGNHFEIFKFNAECLIFQSDLPILKMAIKEIDILKKELINFYSQCKKKDEEIMDRVINLCRKSRSILSDSLYHTNISNIQHMIKTHGLKKYLNMALKRSIFFCEENAKIDRGCINLLFKKNTVSVFIPDNTVNRIFDIQGEFDSAEIVTDTLINFHCILKIKSQKSSQNNEKQA